MTEIALSGRTDRTISTVPFAYESADSAGRPERRVLRERDLLDDEVDEPALGDDGTANFLTVDFLGHARLCLGGRDHVFV